MSAWCDKYRQNARIAVQAMPGDLAAREKPDQRHVAQGLAQYLQLGVPRAEMGAAAARATDVERAPHVACRAALDFVADLRRDTHEVELCSFRIARAKSQTHTGLEPFGDREDLVLPVHRHQVPHGGFRAKLSG